MKVTDPLKLVAQLIDLPIVDKDGRPGLRALIKDPKTAAAIGQFGYALSLGAVVSVTAP